MVPCLGAGCAGHIIEPRNSYGGFLITGVVGTVQAEKAADAVLNWETGAEYEGGGPSPTSEEEAANSPRGSGAACIMVEVRLGPLSPSCVVGFQCKL